MGTSTSKGLSWIIIIFPDFNCHLGVSILRLVVRLGGSANQQPSKLLDVLVLALGQNLGKTDSRKDSYCLNADYFMITVYDSLFRVLPTLFSSLQLDVLSS
jgi:hypothetical protein